MSRAAWWVSLSLAMFVSFAAAAVVVKVRKGDRGDGFAGPNDPSADPCWEIFQQFDDNTVGDGQTCSLFDVVGGGSNDCPVVNVIDSRFPIDMQIERFTVTANKDLAALLNVDVQIRVGGVIAPSNWDIPIGPANVAVTCDFVNDVDSDGGIVDVAKDSCQLIAGSGGRTPILVDAGDDVRVNMAVSTGSSVRFLNVQVYGCPQTVGDLEP